MIVCIEPIYLWLTIFSIDKSRNLNRGINEIVYVINNRPRKCLEGKGMGHWEGDLVISKVRKGELLTLCIDRRDEYPIVKRLKIRVLKLYCRRF